MMSKETIAIAEATEKTGSAIARELAQTGYRLLLISANEDELTNLSAEIKHANPNADIQSTVCYKDACWEADIIILTLPTEAEKGIVEKIKEVATQKIVIRILNKISIFSHPGDDNYLQDLLPYSKVVTVSAGTTNQLTIEGSDEEAVQTVRSLAERANLNSIITGNPIINDTTNSLHF